MRGRTYVGLGLVGLGVTNHLGKTWGSTREERALYLPSDDLVTHPQITTNHAITIRGRAEDVWPWLVLRSPNARRCGPTS